LSNAKSGIDRNAAPGFRFTQSGLRLLRLLVAIHWPGRAVHILRQNDISQTYNGRKRSRLGMEAVMRNKLKPSRLAFCAVLFWSSAVLAQPGLHLTSPDRAAIWRSLGKDAMSTSVPAGLHVGEAVPDTMRLLPFGRNLRNKIPAIKSYSYALLQGQVLIIGRRARTIVSIVSE
jgi:hypothetical protein